MTDTYKVMENDTIESIASKYGTSPEIINFLNNNIKIQPGMIINVPRIQSDYFDYYVVRKGDTLYDIANSFKIEPSLLSKLNGINLDDYIYPNQVLLIPKPGSILYFTADGTSFKSFLESKYSSKVISLSIISLAISGLFIYLKCHGSYV